MKSTRKKHLPLLLIAGLIVLLAGGGIALYGSLASLSKQATERLASQVLGVKVDIGSLDINPESGLVTIRDVTINNPKGYKRGSGITISAIDVKARSLQRERLTLEDIKVSGMNIGVEVSRDGTNLSDLKENIVNRSNNVKSLHAKIQPVGIIIDHIVFAGARIEPAHVTEAIAKDLSPRILPEIHLRGIGEKQQGASLQDAASQVFVYVLNVALRASAEEGYLDSLTPEIQEKIGARISIGEQVMEDAKALINRAPSDAKALERGVKKAFRVNE